VVPLWGGGGARWDEWRCPPEAEETLAQQKVSGPAAVAVIGVALVLFAVVFGRSSLAPKEEPAFVLPPEPPLGSQDIAIMRQGLEPLGITAILPPLLEDRRQGVRVASVKPGGVGEAAGLKPGDLIASFDGQPVAHSVYLVMLVNGSKTGVAHSLTVVRAGKQQMLRVEGLAPLPPEERGRLPM